MSFRIFASGSGNFHFSKNNNIDSSDFDMLKLVESLRTTEPSKMGAGGFAFGQVVPSADMSDAATALAIIEFKHNLMNAMDMLAMCSGVSDGSVSLGCRNSHLLWPDTVTFCQYKFFPGDSPGFEFMKTIAPDLKKADLQTMGVLLALSLVLGKFANQIDQSDTPRLSIQISH